MKKIQTMFSLALGAVLLGTAYDASAQTPRPCYATVVRVQGNVSYSLGDNNWHPLVAGKYLPPGSVIRTGDNGVTDVVMGKALDLPQAKWAPQHISLAVDAPVRGMVSYKPSAEQNMVRLMQNSELGIDKLTTTDTGADTVGDTELNLKAGKIYASVKKLSPAAQYIIKTPTGIAGVRGTQLCIELNPDGTIKSVQVYKTYDDDGLIVSVTFPDHSTKTWMISAGQWVDMATGLVSPIPPQIMNLLDTVFTSLRTTFFQVFGFDLDQTQINCSGDTGNTGNHSSSSTPTPTLIP